MDLLFCSIFFSGTMWLNPPSKSHVIVFFSGKLFFFMHKVILPWMLLSFWKMVNIFLFISLNLNYIRKSRHKMKLPSLASGDKVGVKSVDKETVMAE